MAARHGLMLRWFTDLMNVTEEVTIHRPNASTLLSSASISGDLNAAKEWNRIKYGLDFFSTIFGTILKGEKRTINTKGGVGWSLSLLREGWEAECYYSGRGERRTITSQGGVGGGCNSKHWLMELLLNLTSYFTWFLGWLFACQNFSAGPRRFFIFCHAKVKLPHKHWTSTFFQRKIWASLKRFLRNFWQCNQDSQQQATKCLQDNQKLRNCQEPVTTTFRMLRKPSREVWIATTLKLLKNLLKLSIQLGGISLKLSLLIGVTTSAYVWKLSILTPPTLL